MNLTRKLAAPSQKENETQYLHCTSQEMLRQKRTTRVSDDGRRNESKYVKRQGGVSYTN